MSVNRDDYTPVVKPVLFGLLYGVFEAVDCGYPAHDCVWIEYKLSTLHLSFEAANNKLKSL